MTLTSYNATEARRIGNNAATMAMIGDGECADLYATLAARYALEAMYEQFCAEHPIYQIEGGYTFDALESVFGFAEPLELVERRRRAIWQTDQTWNPAKADRDQAALNGRYL